MLLGPGLTVQKGPFKYDKNKNHYKGQNLSGNANRDQWMHPQMFPFHPVQPSLPTPTQMSSIVEPFNPEQIRQSHVAGRRRANVRDVGKQTVDPGVQAPGATNSGSQTEPGDNLPHQGQPQPAGTPMTPPPTDNEAPEVNHVVNRGFDTLPITGRRRRGDEPDLEEANHIYDRVATLRDELQLQNEVRAAIRDGQLHNGLDIPAYEGAPDYDQVNRHATLDQIEHLPSPTIEDIEQWELLELHERFRHIEQEEADEHEYHRHGGAVFNTQFQRPTLPYRNIETGEIIGRRNQLTGEYEGLRGDEIGQGHTRQRRLFMEGHIVGDNQGRINRAGIPIETRQGVLVHPPVRNIPVPRATGRRRRRRSSTGDEDVHVYSYRRPTDFNPTVRRRRRPATQRTRTRNMDVNQRMDTN